MVKKYNGNICVCTVFIIGTTTEARGLDIRVDV